MKTSHKVLMLVLAMTFLVGCTGQEIVAGVGAVAGAFFSARSSGGSPDVSIGVPPAQPPLKLSIFGILKWIIYLILGSGVVAGGGATIAKGVL